MGGEKSPDDLGLHDRKIQKCDQPKYFRINLTETRRSNEATKDRGKQVTGVTVAVYGSEV